MTTNIPLTSAKIIPFPTRARSTAGGNRSDTSTASQPVSEALSGSWYHDEAIQEALAANWSQKH